MLLFQEQFCPDNRNPGIFAGIGHSLLTDPIINRLNVRHETAVSDILPEIHIDLIALLQKPDMFPECLQKSQFLNDIRLYADQDIPQFFLDLAQRIIRGQKSLSDFIHAFDIF